MLWLVCLSHFFPLWKAAVTFRCLEECPRWERRSEDNKWEKWDLLANTWNPSCPSFLAAKNANSRLSALERAHTWLFSPSPPSRSIGCEAHPDLCRSKTPVQSTQCSPVSIRPSAHATYGHPKPTRHLHLWGGQMTGEEEEQWRPVTACSWCCGISPACRLVPALLPTVMVTSHVSSVRGCTELISWQKLGVIADCYNASLYLVLKGNE